jgi:hypothetical protein
MDAMRYFALVGHNILFEENLVEVTREAGSSLRISTELPTRH